MQQQANIDWCLANREFVNRWLERRGGWQVRDWAVGIGKEEGQQGYVARWQLAHEKSGSHVSTWVVVVAPDSGTMYVPLSLDFVWVPATDDVLEMLRPNVPEGEALRLSIFGDEAHAGSMSRGYQFGPTTLIALMELLKQIEEAT